MRQYPASRRRRDLRDRGVRLALPLWSVVFENQRLRRVMGNPWFGLVS
jgi:hypothetical protein